MKLSVIILYYKTPHHLRICLSYITKRTLPFAWEVIVVDNASTDGAMTMVAQQYPQVRIIQNQKNLGHAAGNNVGIRESKGSIIALCNPDILLKSSQNIENMIAYMDTHPDVGIVGPTLYNPDGTIQSSCYRRYSFLTPLYRRTPLGRTSRGRRDIARHLMEDFHHQQACDVDWLLGAFFLLRRSMLENIGLLNEKFFLYFADYELCDRARRAGWAVRYLPMPQSIVHYHQRESATGRDALRQLFSYATRRHIADWMVYLRLRQ